MELKCDTWLLYHYDSHYGQRGEVSSPQWENDLLVFKSLSLLEGVVRLWVASPSLTLWTWPSTGSIRSAQAEWADSMWGLLPEVRAEWRASE